MAPRCLQDASQMPARTPQEAPKTRKIDPPSLENLYAKRLRITNVFFSKNLFFRQPKYVLHQQVDSTLYHFSMLFGFFFVYFYKVAQDGAKIAPRWPNLAHLGPILAHLGPLLASSWLILAPLGPILAPSWPQLGSILAPLGPNLAQKCPRASKTRPEIASPRPCFRFKFRSLF